MQGRLEQGRMLWLLAIAIALVFTFGLVIFAAISHLSGSTERETEDPIAIAQKLTTSNRSLEIVEISRLDRIIRARHNPSGNVILFTFDDIEAGRTRTSDSGQVLNAAIQVKAPVWVPVYPGWQLQASTQNYTAEEGDTGTFKFVTADKSEQVKNYYDTNLLRENVKLEGEKDINGEWFLQGESEDQRRKISLRLAPHGAGTVTEVTYRSR
jgi:hypothetical protein